MIHIGGIPIAFVTCRNSPMTSSGTFRAEAMKRHLPALGFDPTVLTIPPAWVRQQSGDPGIRVDPEPSVIRTRSLLDRPLIAATAVPGLRKVMRELLLPDVLAPWALSAGRVTAPFAATRLVYATGPPFSALLAARSLSRRLALPLVIEVRDPPSFNRRVKTRSGLTRRRMLSFEERHLVEADDVIVVTAGTRRRLLELHPRLDPDRVHVVPNGFPMIEPDLSLASRDPEAFTVAYVGSYQGDRPGREGSRFTPGVVAEALGRLPGKKELRVVGPVTSEQRARAPSPAQGLRVNFTGPVDRARAVAETAAADVALVLADEDDPWWIGRKVYEALAFAPRILALVPAQGDTAELLEASAKSEVVEGDQELSEAVERLHRDWQAGLVPGGGEPTPPSDLDSARGVARVLEASLSRWQG